MRLGPTPLDDQSESVALGGTRFEAPDGDQNELAREKPDDVAVMTMAGLCAEEVLLGGHLREGWLKDIEILRIGLGWLEGTDEPPARFFQYLAHAHQATRIHESAIRDVAEALLEARCLSGSQVTALAA